LSLAAEQEYSVPTLPLEDAVELFDPAFSADDAVGEICKRLDGLPLAVELAAARIKVLTPEQILNRLDRRFDTLRSTARDAPAR
jgi:predicted ATPase